LFQLIDLKRIFCSIRPPAGHQEATQTPIGLGQHQKAIRHRRRNKELVADQFVRLPGPALTERESPGGIAPHVTAALLLGHRHADREPLLLRIGSVAAIVNCVRYLRQPRRGDIRLLVQRRHAGERHHDRATVTCVDLCLQIQHRRAHDMSARCGLDPWQGMQPISLRHRHQLVVRGMVFDFVHAMAVAVVGFQPGWILVGESPPLDTFRRPAGSPEFAQPAFAPLAAKLPHSVAQRGIL